jgi:hypothetical protein
MGHFSNWRTTGERHNFATQQRIGYHARWIALARDERAGKPITHVSQNSHTIA